MFGSESGFAHEASNVERAGEDVTEILGLGAVGLAKPGRAFQVSPGLVGISAFGVTEATDAWVPGGGPHLEVTGQAHIVFGWEGGPDGDRIDQGTGWVSIRTESNSCTLFMGQAIRKAIGYGMGDTSLSHAHPSLPFSRAAQVRLSRGRKHVDLPQLDGLK